MGLEATFGRSEEGITVPYPPIFDEIRRNSGFVDLRGRPDLAASIAEGTSSPALKALLVRLADPHCSLFTLGCDLGAHEEPSMPENRRYVAGGYVQLLYVGYAQCDGDMYLNLAESIQASLEQGVGDHSWQLAFILTAVQLNLDKFFDLTPSLWIWFYAAASGTDAALMSREKLIEQLHKALPLSIGTHLSAAG